MEDMLTCLHGKVRLELVLNEYKVCHTNRHLYFMISISLNIIEWIKIEGSNVINLDIPATNGVVQVLESVVQVFHSICENETFFIKHFEVLFSLFVIFHYCSSSQK